MHRVPTKVPTVTQWAFDEDGCKLLKNLEARAGIEPAHKGFADLSLTTWVPRLGRAALKNSRSKSPQPTRSIPEGEMERETRFELATLALARRCSTTELLPRTKLSIPGHLNQVKPPPAFWLPRGLPQPLPSPFLPLQSPRRACTECGWRWPPPRDCG